MNNKTEIYFVRHAECIGNLEKRLCGRTDFNLSYKGKMQADRIGKMMSDIYLDIIFSSPLQRAKDTAIKIKENHNKKLEMEIVNDFTEVDFGTLDGMLHKVARNRYPKEMTNWTFVNRYPEGLPKQESIEEAQERFLERLYKILTTNNYNSICIVTHGTILRSVIAKFLNYSKEEYCKIPQFKNASITKVIFDKSTQTFKVKYIGK